MHKALGKGLEALLPSARSVTASYNTALGTVKDINQFEIIDIDKITFSRFQPRKNHSDDKLKELSESIKAHGLAQPVLVTPKSSPGEFELVAGERRMRAAKLAGLTKVPAIIRKLSDQEHLELSLIENLQREDLNPLDKANGIQRLIDEFEMTQDEASKALGISRPAVANLLRLLNLPDAIRNALANGEISEGHGRALLGVPNLNIQKKLLNRIKNEGLSVREIEALIFSERNVKSHRTAKRTVPEISELQNELQGILGRKVEIMSNGKKGWLKLAFYSLDDFDVMVNQIKSVARVK